jgi:crotonobetainyl-CoA:carnitine CoA-transferase CaiB-like acyl-CoA transferase
MLLVFFMTPLDNIFVLDLSRILSGPICTMLMADMGAEVVKVEPPPHGDDTRLWGPPFINGISTYFLSINRNKKSLGLNLKSAEGRDVLWKLIDRADVLVENFRPGVLKKLGFGYEEVARRNQRLIYCSISGFGQTGPYRDRPGYDVVAQGESGLMDLTGYPAQPPAKLGASLADIIAGLYALNGILLALLVRHRTGRGQAIDISLLDGMVSTLTYQAMIYFATGQSPQRMGTRHPSIVPYECFQTKDGFANIGVANEKQWASLCEAVGLPQLAADPRFDTMAARIEHYDELRPILERVFSQMTRADVIRLLGAGGIAVGPVNTVAEALEHPQVRAREMVAELIHPEYGPMRYLGIPINLSATPGEMKTAPPMYGEHNEQVLTELGLSAAAITQLTASKVLDGALTPVAPQARQNSK